MSHELVEGFRAEHLRLRRTLEEMLDEAAVHRTERRGCGYTQATRFLSTFINAPIDPAEVADLDMFEDWPTRDTRFAASALVAAGWPLGWRRADEIDAEHLEKAAQYRELIQSLALLRPRIVKLAEALELPESRILARLVLQILMRDGSAPQDLPPMPIKPEIGSCSQAEEFFLELAHGRVRRGGSVNVFVDEHFHPLLIEKMNLGESHSAMVLETVRLNGVDLPPGSLLAIAHIAAPCGDRIAHGHCLPLAAIAETRFLRLTTLSVEPADRKRAFSAQLEAEIRGNMLGPTTTTLSELRRFAAQEVQALQ